MGNKIYKTVYVVNNEFHLFIVLTQFLKYHKPNNDNILVIITKQPQSKRTNIEKYNLPFNFLFLEDDFTNFTISHKINYKGIVLQNISQANELIVFHDSHFLNTLLAKLFKKYFKSKIILCQEGIAGYYKRKIYFVQFYRFILKYFFFRFIKLYPIRFVRSWGLSRLNDEIRMIMPEKVKEKVKAPVKNLDILLTLDQVTQIHRIFNFELSNYFRSREKVVLFLTMGNAKRTRHLKDKEIAIMKELYHLSKRNGYKFVIKAKGNENINLYKKHIPEDAIFLTESVNAELITFAVHNSLIFSWFSSTNLYNVNGNQYFWLYPLLGLQDLGVDKIKHIRVINKMNEIAFQDFIIHK